MKKNNTILFPLYDEPHYEPIYGEDGQTCLGNIIGPTMAVLMTCRSNPLTQIRMEFTDVDVVVNKRFTDVKVWLFYKSTRR